MQEIVLTYIGEGEFKQTATARILGCDPKYVIDTLATADAQRYIADVLGRKLRSLEVTPSLVLQELAAIGFSDIGNLIEIGENGQVVVKDWTDMDPRIRRTVKKVKLRRVGGGDNFEDILEIEFHDKMKALELLARYTKLLGDAQERQGEGDGQWTGLQIQPPANGPARLFHRKDSSSAESG